MQLASGAVMPCPGLGTWRVDASAIPSLISSALAQGYRHFDCAALYRNESAVGAALAGAIASGVVSRGELFITGKLPMTDMALPAGGVEAALRASLADLQLDYFDLYLTHWPVALSRAAQTRAHAAALAASDASCAIRGTA